MAWSQKSIKYEVMLVELPQQTPSAARLLIKTLCGVGSEVEKSGTAQVEAGVDIFIDRGTFVRPGQSVQVRLEWSDVSLFGISFHRNIAWAIEERGSMEIWQWYTAAGDKNPKLRI